MRGAALRRLGVLAWLVGGLACTHPETRVRLVVRPATEQPSALRITLFGKGRLVFPTTLPLGQNTLPGAVILRNLDAATPDFRVLVEGLDASGSVRSVGATLVPLHAGRDTDAIVQLGALADGDGDGVPDLIDDCPATSDADQLCMPTGAFDLAGSDFAISVDLPTTPADLATDLASSDAAQSPPDLSGTDLGGGCPGSAMFCDDFESGDFTKWDGNGGAGTTVLLTNSTAAAHRGTHALRVQTSGGTDTRWLRHSFPGISTGSVFLRVFLYSGTTIQYPLYVLFMHRGTGDTDYVFGLDNFVGDSWYIFNKNPGNAWKTPGSFAAGAWHCLEMQVELTGTTNIVHAWVDGGTEGVTPTQTGTDAAPSLSEIDIGVSYQNTLSSNDLFLDDLVVATSRIGCN